MSELGTPTYCQQCGRANSAAARRCMWCDVPLKRGTLQKFEPTRVEIEYLGGIDGLEDPTTVRLTISSSGIEVRSLTPGSKMSTISAYSIIDARVVDASTVTDGGRARAPWWWWLVLGPFALMVRGKKLPDVKEHDYIFTVRYKRGNEVSSAVFHREDKMGLSMVEGLARIVTALVQRTAKYPS
jgi:hypothetical protein